MVSFAVTLCNFCLTVRQIIYITPKGRAHQCKSWVMVKKALISGWCKFSFYIILLNRHYFRSYCYKSKILYEWHKLGQDMYFKKNVKTLFPRICFKNISFPGSSSVSTSAVHQWIIVKLIGIFFSFDRRFFNYYSFKRYLWCMIKHKTVLSKRLRCMCKLRQKIIAGSCEKSLIYYLAFSHRACSILTSKS